VLSDGTVVAHAAVPGRLTAPLPRGDVRAPAARVVNLAVNNDRGAYPWVTASYSAPHNPPTYLVDGNYWYMPSPPNRWTTVGSPHASDTVIVDFGTDRTIQDVVLYVLDDGDHATVRAPERGQVDVWRDGRWRTVAAWSPNTLAGHRANRLRLTEMRAAKVRIVLAPRRGSAMGLSEIEVWGPAQPIRR
jgi:hypothetical protein